MRDEILRAYIAKNKREDQTPADVKTLLKDIETAISFPFDVFYELADGDLDKIVTIIEIIWDEAEPNVILNKLKTQKGNAIVEEQKPVQEIINILKPLYNRLKEEELTEVGIWNLIKIYKEIANNININEEIDTEMYHELIDESLAPDLNQIRTRQLFEIAIPSDIGTREERLEYYKTIKNPGAIKDLDERGKGLFRLFGKNLGKIVERRKKSAAEMEVLSKLDSHLLNDCNEKRIKFLKGIMSKYEILIAENEQCEDYYIMFLVVYIQYGKREHKKYQGDIVEYVKNENNEKNESEEIERLKELPIICLLILIDEESKSIRSEEQRNEFIQFCNVFAPDGPNYAINFIRLIDYEVNLMLLINLIGEKAITYLLNFKPRLDKDGKLIEHPDFDPEKVIENFSLYNILKKLSRETLDKERTPEFMDHFLRALGHCEYQKAIDDEILGVIHKNDTKLIIPYLYLLKLSCHTYNSSESKRSRATACYPFFVHFVERFDQVNNRKENSAQQRRDIYEMLDENFEMLVCLHEIIGDKLFVILEKYLVTSGLSLERLLKNLMIDESLIQEQMQLFFRFSGVLFSEKGTELFDLFLKILSMIKLWGIMNDKTGKGTNILQVINFSKMNSLEEIYSNLGQQLTKRFLQITGQNEDTISIDEILNRMPLNTFINLMIAGKAMESKYFFPIFQEFVHCDLTGESFDERAPDYLKTFNKNIRGELKAAGIDVDKAFDKRRPACEFSVGGQYNGIDVEFHIGNLWQALILISKVNDKLTQKIHNFQRSMIKGYQIGEPLNAEQKIKLMQQLIKEFGHKESRLANLSQQLGKALDKNDDTLKQFMEARKTIESSITGDEVKLLAKRNYRIVVWDKSRSDTFNLGDEIGCCLAPNGGEFPAMVQRRMDDAMFMHVVIDEATQKPVSLAWLFYGKAKPPDEGIYVVANFFEINSTSARHTLFRDEIILNLRKYVAEFAKDIGAKGFALNKMEYGAAGEAACRNCPEQKIAFDKVGGFLKLPDYENSGSNSSYYLTSLENNQFHLFPMQTLSPTRSMVRHLQKKSPPSTNKTLPPVAPPKHDT